MAGVEASEAGDERALFAPSAEAYPPGEGMASVLGRAGGTEVAPPAGRRRATALLPRRGAAGVREAIPEALLAEWGRGAGFLFVPVCLCIGALIYFSLTEEPDFRELLLIICALGAGVLLARDRMLARHLLLGLMLVAVGMGLAKFETWRTATKIIGGEISTHVTGRVVQIEHRANGRVRLTIDILETARPKLRYSPDRIRVTARSIPDAITTGSGITGLVRLRQPSGPVRPGSYDFAFNNYFDGIGGSGFFLGAPHAVQLAQPPPLHVRVAAMIERARNALASHIRGSVGGSEGAIAAALITGVTAGIPEEANEAMRVSGIYHVISISGLHLALVAGTVMLSMRAAFALFPAFASRRPVKKYAAAIALAVVFLYLFMSGAEVATQRSFIMLAVMLLALLFDRAALTMRNLAIAAIIVIAVSPHEVAGPSFQMSFAATAALIAAYAWWSERRVSRTALSGRRSEFGAASIVRLVLLYGGGIAMTSIVAGAATALFGAWHFNRVAPLGLVANLAAMPVVSFVVMPFAVLAMLLMPFGLDHLALAVMGKGIGVMMMVAEWVAERSPFDVVGMIPVSAVLFFSAALVVLTMTTTVLRLAAAPLLLAGVLSLFARQPPDLLLAEDGRLAAMRMEDSRIAVNRERPNGFTTDNWMRALAATAVIKPEEQSDDVETVPVPFETRAGFSCRAGLCLARHRSGALIAHAADAQSAAPVCGAAVLVVIDDATAGNVCAGKSAIVTKRHLARRGSAAVHMRQTAAGIRAKITYAISEPYRPWHSHRAFSRPARGMPPYKPRERKRDPQKLAPGDSVPASDGSGPSVRSGQ